MEVIFRHISTTVYGSTFVLKPKPEALQISANANKKKLVAAVPLIEKAVWDHIGADFIEITAGDDVRLRTTHGITRRKPKQWNDFKEWVKRQFRQNTGQVSGDTGPDLCGRLSGVTHVLFPRETMSTLRLR